MKLVERAITHLMAQLTVPQIARMAGVSPNTARRFIRPYFEPSVKRGWQRFDADKAEELVALCRKQIRRHCLNRFNSQPIETN